MAFRLIPREEKFYDDFEALAEQIRFGAGLLDAMLAPERPIWDKADEIKEVEHKCDFLTHEVIQRLNRTFVTPLDREDIHTLARTLDDVMDAIDASATILRLYHIDNVRPGARELSRIIVDSTDQVVCAMKALEGRAGWPNAPSKSTASRTRQTARTRRPSAAVRGRERSRSRS